MRKKRFKLLLMVIIALGIAWMLRLEWVQAALNDEQSLFGYITEGTSYEILLITIPLFILQGVISVFPFITLLLIHIHVFGFWEGLLFTWIGSFLGAITCFYLGRFFAFDYFEKMWENNFERYKKWIQLSEKYGLWGIVILRHVPILPSNIISLIGAFSPMKQGAYIISSVIGNLSMAWLYTLVVKGFITTQNIQSPYVFGYIIFAMLVIISFYIHVKKSKLAIK